MSTESEKKSSEAGHSSEAVGGQSTASLVGRAQLGQQQEVRECGLPQVGLPHPVVRETEDERKSRLSGQRIADAMSRLLPGTQIYKGQK